MSYVDLQSTLVAWPYDSEQISVRKILGTDGGVRLQMRVELGVLQMEPTGRPDGIRPHGCESLLEYHQKRLAQYEERNGMTVGFVLSPQQCEELRFEASLYYRRYVSEFVLEEYAEVIRDTTQNLAIFDLCRDCAAEADDRTCLEAFRSYVLMMNARARAYQALQENEPASALAHANRGIMNLMSYFEQHDAPEAAESSEEVRLLRMLVNEVSQALPKNSLVSTRKALRSAIEQERFEEAARLHDQLNELQNRD